MVEPKEPVPPVTRTVAPCVADTVTVLSSPVRSLRTR